MTKSTVHFKIQNPEGLFSTGGASPTFSKTGKTWSSIAHVKSHLSQGVVYYDGCEIVEVVEVISKSKNYSLQILIEQNMVKQSIESPAFEFAYMIDMLTKFVNIGTCYSTDFKEYITEKKSNLVETLVPVYVIENFDAFHNKGIKGCTDSELAAIMLTATSYQQTIYKV